MVHGREAVKRVTVAEGRRNFSRLLKEIRAEGGLVLIVDSRSHELVGALFSPEEYRRYERLRPLLEALWLSAKFEGRGGDVVELIRAARKELDQRV